MDAAKDRLFYCNKLFGGFRNGQRYDLDSGQDRQFFARLSRAGWISSYATHDLTYRQDEVIYTRRRIGSAWGAIIFFAECSLSEEEAAERFWQYLMRCSGSKQV